MSRKIIIVLVSAALLGAICTAEQIAVHRITAHAYEQTQEILAGIRDERLEDAMQKAHALDRAWDERAGVLEMIVNHSSTDEVRYAISRLIAALEKQDTATAMVYAAELEGGIAHVNERQAFTLENIF